MAPSNFGSTLVAQPEFALAKQPPPGHKRSARACNFCRRRKIKCRADFSSPQSQRTAPPQCHPCALRGLQCESAFFSEEDAESSGAEESGTKWAEPLVPESYKKGCEKGGALVAGSRSVTVPPPALNTFPFDFNVGANGLEDLDSLSTSSLQPAAANAIDFNDELQRLESLLGLDPQRITLPSDDVDQHISLYLDLAQWDASFLPTLSSGLPGAVWPTWDTPPSPAVWQLPSHIHSSVAKSLFNFLLPAPRALHP